jgi:hypothetical protein
MTRPVPARHWRSYGDDPLPSGREPPIRFRRSKHPLTQILRISLASLIQHPGLRFRQPETQESQINPVSEVPAIPAQLKLL